MQIHTDQVISVKHFTAGEAEDSGKKCPSCLMLESLCEWKTHALAAASL